MCMLVSCISIIYISCDQLSAVVRPFSYKQTKIKTTIITIAVIWMIAIGLSLPLFFWRVYSEYHYNDDTIAGCTFSEKMKQNKYLLIITVLMVYVPAVVVSIAYTIIISKLDKYNRLLMNKVHTLKIKYRNKVSMQLCPCTINISFYEFRMLPKLVLYVLKFYDKLEYECKMLASSL